MRRVLLLLACLLLPLRLDAAWAYKAGSGAHNGNGGTSTSPVAVTLGAAVSVGDRVIVAISAWRTTTNPSIAGVTDGLGNAYTLDKSTGLFTQDPGFPQLVAVYSATITNAGTPTVSVAGTYEGCGVGLAAYSGVSTSAGAGAAVDVSAAANGNSTSASSGATAVTTAANELTIGVYGDDGFNQPTPSTHFGTTRVWHQTSTDGQVGIFDNDSGASGSTQTATMTPNGAATPWGMLAVVYQLSGAVVVTPHRLSLLGVGGVNP